MKISITKSFTFEAAHQLINHSGKCARLHGHSYRFEVTVAGEIVSGGSSSGMIMDFGELSEMVNSEIVEQWDHYFLNDLFEFPTTVEFLAGEIFSRLKKVNVPVVKIKLWETTKSFATVEE